MKKALFLLVCVFLLTNIYVIAQVEIEGSIAIIVDPNLLPGIREGLNHFETDLQNEGYIVIERIYNFLNPPELRVYLQGLYDTEQNLVGSILIGNIPHAYQWFVFTYSNPDIPPVEHEVISFQYYSDLDGIYDSSPNYTSPGGHEYSYDIHNGEIDWEIWVGVLPMYKGDYSSTIAALNRYFEKNHEYRIGGYSIPRAFMQITEHFSASTMEEHNLIIQSLSTGVYAWTPFSSASNANFYFDSPPANLSVDQGYSALSAGEADFTVGDAHGYWGAHGQINISWVENNPVNTVFFWSNGCAVGNIDYAENFITSLLYSSTSAVIVAKGTTNNSGGMGNNENGFFGHNIATSLSNGDNLGQAILNHVNVPLIWPWSNNREFHFASSIIVGDPTIRLTKQCDFPSIPTNPSPPNGKRGVSTNAILDWDDCYGASYYDVYFDDTSPPSFVDNVSSSSFIPTQLNPFTTYYWRIVAKNTCGNTPGPIWSFTTHGEVIQYTLTIASSSGGTTSPVPGDHLYDSGTQVQVTALPENDYNFIRWEGDISIGHDTDNPITITMDDDKSIIANFAPKTQVASYMLSPVDFNQSQDENDYWFNRGYLYLKSGSSGNYFYAPVHMPQNAALTSVVVFYFDNDASGDLEMTLYKVNAYTESIAVMGTFTSSGALDSKQTHKIAPITGNGNMINNTGYFYNLCIRFTDSNAGENVRVYKVKINYKR